MAALDDLLGRITDPALRLDLERELAPLRGERELGLVFERHMPEKVRLPGLPVRAGSFVELNVDRSSPTWQVLDKADETAQLRRRTPDGAVLTEELPVADLVVVREFGQPIYPGLRSVGRVERGGDKPFHTVLKAENYHALETLLYTSEGKVDAIYIDPPYNTGARDWKYNNDYVDGGDAYRHSKWLSFMEKRLQLAKRLLRPESSVLIVTIDEKEYLRLGLLLEQTFRGADIQMVSSVINRAGSPRAGRFSRVDEYIFYVFQGTASVSPWTSTMLSDGSELSEQAMPTVWFTAVRRGSGASRQESKNLFYPVIINATTGAFIRVGDPLPKNVDRNTVSLDAGEIAIWPLGAGGAENRWRFSAELMRKYFAAGAARLGKRDPDTGLRPVTYLQPGTLENIKNGTFVVTGKSQEGALELALAEGGAKNVAPRSVWSRTSHFARDHGSHLVNTLLPGRTFPFPKSLYAVEDALRFVVASKPDALVVDFFGGSGTTAHAVMRLNKQDGGRRRSILVTNNEVGPEAEAAFEASGVRPGAPEWEAVGIFEYITKPRLQAAVTGRTSAGAEVVRGVQVRR